VAKEFVMKRETMLQYTLSRLCADLAPDMLVETHRRNNLDRLISRDFRSGNSLSYAALVIVERVLDRAVQLVVLKRWLESSNRVLGHSAAVYVELHAALERYVIEALPKALGKDDRSRKAITLLIDRKTLSDLAPHLVTIGRWTKADLAFVRRLARLRNAVAHRNEASLQKVVGGSPHSYSDEPFVRLNRTDASSDLVETLKLMIKATRFRRKSKRRSVGAPAT
jgi:hypothetical protein